MTPEPTARTRDFAHPVQGGLDPSLQGPTNPQDYDWETRTLSVEDLRDTGVVVPSCEQGAQAAAARSPDDPVVLTLGEPGAAHRFTVWQGAAAIAQALQAGTGLSARVGRRILHYDWNHARGSDLEEMHLLQMMLALPADLGQSISLERLQGLRLVTRKVLLESYIGQVQADFQGFERVLDEHKLQELAQQLRRQERTPPACIRGARCLAGRGQLLAAHRAGLTEVSVFDMDQVLELNGLAPCSSSSSPSSQPSTLS